MSLKLVNGSEEVFKEYCETYLPDLKHTPDPHLTLIYSKKPFDGEIKTEDYIASGIVKGYNVFGQTGERALVAEIGSEDIVERNRVLVEKYGFISDFDEFKPHITLAYDIPEDFDFSDLPEFPEPLYFGNETVEDLKLDRKDS